MFDQISQPAQTSSLQEQRVIPNATKEHNIELETPISALIEQLTSSDPPTARKAQKLLQNDPAHSKIALEKATRSDYPNLAAAAKEVLNEIRMEEGRNILLRTSTSRWLNGMSFSRGSSEEARAWVENLYQNLSDTDKTLPGRERAKALLIELLKGNASALYHELHKAPPNKIAQIEFAMNRLLRLADLEAIIYNAEKWGFVQRRH